MKGEMIFRKDNIAKMFLSTAIAMIFTEVTGVISVLMDGIVTSRFLGVDVYSGISLLRPFTSMILMIAARGISFFSLFLRRTVSAARGSPNTGTMLCSCLRASEEMKRITCTRRSGAWTM